MICQPIYLEIQLKILEAGYRKGVIYNRWSYMTPRGDLALEKRIAQWQALMVNSGVNRIRGEKDPDNISSALAISHRSLSGNLD